jgi:hypothetical protein
MKKIVAVIAVAAALVIGVLWHKHRVKARALSSGEVYVREQPSAPSKPLSPAQTSGNEEIAATPEPTSPPVSATPPTAVPEAAAPTGDSIPRNPPNGLAFAAAGKFQLYRQGDITWRLDTQSGSACILFATDAQWRRPRVYQAGCGTHAETTIATGD